MTNVQRYEALLDKREATDDQTKELEKVIFAEEGSVSEAELQKWHKLELKRRAQALEVARQWQTLTPEERRAQNAKYTKTYGRKHG